MPTQQNNQPTLGAGLIPNSQLTEAVEQKIISYLALHDVIVCANVNNNPWRQMMIEEFKRRSGCVTVYTWPGETSSIAVTFRNWLFASYANLGHSALRTYSGGETGKGFYVSFYPGNCNVHARTPSCRKSISHFHTWNQENRDGAVAVDIYRVDVEAINQAFQTMHDGNMDAVRQWSTQHNCSDVVLALLEAGGFCHHLHQYSWKSTVLSALMFIELARILSHIEYRYACKTNKTLLETVSGSKLLKGLEPLLYPDQGITEIFQILIRLAPLHGFNKSHVRFIPLHKFNINYYSTLEDKFKSLNKMTIINDVIRFSAKMMYIYWIFYIFN